MPGLVPGIHVLDLERKDVGGRVKPGHDEVDRFFLIEKRRQLRAFVTRVLADADAALYWYARMLVGGEADHFDDDFVADARALGPRITHRHRLREDLAIDLDVTRPAALLIDTDKLVRVALNDLNDLARLPQHTTFAAGLAPT